MFVYGRIYLHLFNDEHNTQRGLAAHRLGSHRASVLFWLHACNAQGDNEGDYEALSVAST